VRAPVLGIFALCALEVTFLLCALLVGEQSDDDEEKYLLVIEFVCLPVRLFECVSVCVLVSCANGRKATETAFVKNPL